MMFGAEASATAASGNEGPDRALLQFPAPLIRLEYHICRSSHTWLRKEKKILYSVLSHDARNAWVLNPCLHHPLKGHYCHLKFSLGPNRAEFCTIADLHTKFGEIWVF